MLLNLIGLDVFQFWICGVGTRWEYTYMASKGTRVGIVDDINLSINESSPVRIDILRTNVCHPYIG